MKPRRSTLITFTLAALTTFALAGGSPEARADGPEAFGPVDSRTFAWKAGTAIEKATDQCDNNADWLLIRGPNVAKAKSLEISPATTHWEHQKPATGTCLAPDCVQIFVEVTSKDATGARTVTLKHADGRSITTTFDISANAGRCDYPKKGGSGGGKKK